MKKFTKFLWIAFAAFSMTFASCSDNDDEPNPGVTDNPSIAEVFPEGVPASVNDWNIELNEKGQVVKMVNSEGDSEIIFEYGDFSRSTKFNAVMRYRDKEEPFYNYDIYMQLNDRGFVNYAVMIYHDEEDERWEFEYNSDGQMTRMINKYDMGRYNMETINKYVNGDITEIKVSEDNETEYSYYYSYTNSQYSNPVANKSGIMLYEDTYYIDINEMKYAFWAGLLGKATKNLPMVEIWDDEDEEGSTEFFWEFNSNQLPVKFYDCKECFEDNYPDVVISWK